jgi:hypothetical protein
VSASESVESASFDTYNKKDLKYQNDPDNQKKRERALLCDLLKVVLRHGTGVQEVVRVMTLDHLTLEMTKAVKQIIPTALVDVPNPKASQIKKHPSSNWGTLRHQGVNLHQVMLHDLVLDIEKRTKTAKTKRDMPHYALWWFDGCSC